MWNEICVRYDCQASCLWWSRLDHWHILCLPPLQTMPDTHGTCIRQAKMKSQSLFSVPTHWSNATFTLRCFTNFITICSRLNFVHIEKKTAIPKTWQSSTVFMKPDVWLKQCSLEICILYCMSEISYIQMSEGMSLKDEYVLVTLNKGNYQVKPSFGDAGVIVMCPTSLRFYTERVSQKKSQNDFFSHA